MTTHIIERTATFDAVRTLAPAIVARSEEIERGRRVPADLVKELTAAGCFQALVPRSHGGAELDLPDDMRVLEELARADGSVGWTVMIGSLAPVLLGKLPRATFDDLYAEGPDIILAGTIKPSGVATPVDGGFRVTGQWAFASGCQHSDWFVAHSIVDDGRQPPIRMMVLPPADVEIKDTWSVSGLCGTGSHDFAANDAVVPDERSFVLWDEPCLDAPLLRIPELSLSSLRGAAVAVGIAHGAVREVTDLATGKVPLFSVGTLASNPLFQHQLADADAQLRAARALLYADAETAWTAAVAGTPFTPGAPGPDTGHGHMGGQDGGVGGRHGLYRRRRNLALRHQSPAAPPARHPRPDPALRGEARHLHQGRCGAGWPRRRPHVPVTASRRGQR
jgi:alkylation response protein AidB-like acyl-CoA dehydrogenase